MAEDGVVRDPGHLAMVRNYPCVVAGATSLARVIAGQYPSAGGERCSGITAAHHHTGHRGRGQKGSDHRAFPLCTGHHAAFHGAHGVFKHWTKEDRRRWQDAMADRFQPTDDVF